ncbi:MAG: L,D-transpeptidase family protein [Candidatus Omnitrophica bacterium]|nr:L,D-transpeptidase family protein [Candidatus Omnitrophota bacterium]
MMRRRIVVAVVAAGVALAVIGLLMVAGQQGWFGGKPKRLLARGLHAQQAGQWPEAQKNFEELIATYPDAPWTDQALLGLGQVYEAQQQWVEARATYQRLVEQFPNSRLMSATQSRLGHVNVSLLFSPTLTDLDREYEVQPGDSLGKIAAANSTTVELLRKANNLKSDVIRPRQKLKVPKGKFSIVVDKSQNELLLTEEDRFVKSYVIATGKDNSTPVGAFKIVTKIPNPVWYKQGAVVPPESPENILGTRWLGLNKQGYGIHGSVDPAALGKQVTAGCVRMANHDVEELFGIVPVGTDVTIVD